MKIVRSQNANEISEFYPHEIFHDGAIFEIFLKKSFFRKMQKIVLLLYEFSRGNQVDGSPRVAIGKRKSREPRTQVHLTMKITF